MDTQCGATAEVTVPSGAVVCSYGTAEATRVGDGEPLCQAHAQEHYGRGWRTDTTKLTPRKATRYLAGESL